MTAKALLRNDPSVTAARSRSGLEAIMPAWEDLAAHALEANPLYEPWMLLPALEALGDPADFRCLLVWSADGERLDGLFPFQRVRRFKGLPASALSSWHAPSWLLGTPLVRAQSAAACVQALLDWLDRLGKGSSMVQFRYLPCDGAFRGVLADVLRERQATVVTTESFTRGLLRKPAAGRSTLEAAMSGESRRKLRRKERRLGERGAVTHVALQDARDVDRWIDELLRLEGADGNRRQGAALGARETDRRFAAAALRAAFQRGRLQMVGVDVDGWPIARRCILTAGEGAYAFRGAYHPDFGYFSPGLIAEADSMRAFDALPGLQWMDSIADPVGKRINRLWKERRTVQSLAVASGAWGEMCVSLIPILGWANRRMTPTRRPAIAAEAAP
jgi:CelD/BcsL family acetyltransferase involved in cellulose biosynthesis